jgi:hypothetical protein
MSFLFDTPKVAGLRSVFARLCYDLFCLFFKATRFRSVSDRMILILFNSFLCLAFDWLLTGSMALLISTSDTPCVFVSLLYTPCIHSLNKTRLCHGSPLVLYAANLMLLNTVQN